MPGSMRGWPLLRVFTAAILVAIALATPAPVSASPEDDAYLRGVVDSWLAHVHGIGPDQVRVAVADGVVTLTGTLESPERIQLIVEGLESLQGVKGIVNRLEVAPPPEGDRWRSWWSWLQPAPGHRTVHFPRGDLFVAPLADQKQPRFHTTYQRYHVSFGDFDIASVGFGESFGLVRWPREREGDGWQVGISGAVFAIFNLDAPSKDLLNADYILGIPVSYRSGPWSGRLRLYHQSSHLGDEFLLEPQPGPPVTRINLSYETMEILASYERDGLRFYGGGQQILSSDTPLGRDRAQIGVEYRGNPIGWRTARLIAGLDVQAWDETGWDRDKSLKVGLHFQSPYGEARSLQILLEYYEGHAPHGQFYTRIVEYFGFGIAFPF